MARKKKTRSSNRSSKKVDVREGPELINGRGMMAVYLLYEELENPKREGRGKSYIQKYLRDYKDKQHQKLVLECLPGCFEVLLENKRARKQPFDAELLEDVKRFIVVEMGYIWEGKKRPVDKKKIPVVEIDDETDYTEEEEKVEPPPQDDSEPEEEEVDWGSRFADGEFDLD